MLPEKSESQIFEIMDYKYPDFIEKINYLIRKANKLNLPPIVYNITGKFEKIIKIWDSERINSIDCKVTIYTVEISGFRPTIEGYTLIAKIEHLPTGNIINSISSTDIPEIYRNTSPTCDHCKINRLRNFTYIIRNNDTNEYKQIGSTCLADYLNNMSAANIAEFYASFYPTLNTGESEESDFDNIRQGKFNFSIVKYLIYVNRAIKQNGYLSRSKAYGKPSTCDIALDDMINGKIQPTNDEISHIEKIINTVKIYLSEKPQLNDYESNLNILITSEFIRVNHIGYVSSIIPLYNRIMEDKIKIESDNTVFLGEIGGKLSNIIVKLLSQLRIDGNYGITFLYTFQDANNNIIIWFSSTDQYLNNEEDIKILKCTVKDHKIYKSTKQTIITRAKLEKIS